MLSPQLEFDPGVYAFPTARVLTPALAIYPEIVRSNIRATLNLLGGDPRRWRPHLKTVKLAATMRLLRDAGIEQVKCATTRELAVACHAGFHDVLVAYAHNGANAARVAGLAAENPSVRVSAIVESIDQVALWRNTRVSLFIDINSGMNRTGAEAGRTGDIVALASAIRAVGIEFRGLHFYDGHATEEDLAKRTAAAHARYDGLIGIVAALQTDGSAVKELVTTGTPALPCAVSYRRFTEGSFVHRVSPGTVVYNDITSLKQLPSECGFRAAVAVASRVISHPKPGVITCDAGHKSVSADAGIPNCAVVGHPDFVPLKPSEEHLPIAIPDGAAPPPLGAVLYLVPRHVCPTVNNANFALLVGKDSITPAEVTARGHECPLPSISAPA